MPDFDDSTLWRISAYERIRRERGSSVFAALGEATILPTTMVADLRRLESHHEGSDVLEVLAACLRHRQSALICMQYHEYVWPITVFPTEGVYHSPRDVAAASPEGMAHAKVVSCEPAGVRPPGHWMHDRVARADQYHQLKSLLWTMALIGPRDTLLNEIGGHAAYRSTLATESRPATPGALGPVADRLRRETASLREIARWPGMSTERASRLLNALYLASGLMVMRTHPSARGEPQTIASRFGLGKPKR
jgi:hypothetical protein